MPYQMTDDSVTKPGKGHPEYSGKSVTRRGEEEHARNGKEPRRNPVSKKTPRPR